MRCQSFNGKARSVKELLTSIRNGKFTLDGRNLIVRGNLSLKNLGLTSLLGCPKYVGGEFNCSGNELKTLEGAPQKVGSFDCSHNNLQTLNGGPQEVGTYFICDYNKLETLEGGPIKVGATYSCSNNKLISLKGAPRVVGYNFYCRKNKLSSLEGCPRIIGGSLYCEKNKLLTSLEGGPRYVVEDVYLYGCPSLIFIENFHLYLPKVLGKFYFKKKEVCMYYKVIRNGVTVAKGFSNYEKARQFLRKLLRKKDTVRVNRQPDPLSALLFGYEIVRVDK